MAVGITMVALGPFLFAGNSPGTTSYWNALHSIDSISYGSGAQFSCGGGPSSSVFIIVNNGNGNPSYTQYLEMEVQQ